MRKTDQKRQHILDTANRLFQSKGFANTTMSEITSEAGGSKATVYNYFSSKDELFVECLTSVSDRYLEGMFSGLQDTKAETSAALLDTAKNVLRYLCSPEMLANKRLLINEAERSGIGKHFYKKMDGYMEELAVFLRRAMDKGDLRQSDPILAARQLRTLVESDMVERCLMGAEKVPPSAATVSKEAQNALETFFRAYGPDGDGDTQVAKPAPDTVRASRQDPKKATNPKR